MSEESRKHNSHAAESWRELAGDVGPDPRKVDTVG